MKSVLIFSGGLDSTTLLFKLKKDNQDVHAITFSYGQKHSIELEYAKKIASVLGIEHKIVDMSSLQTLLDSALTNPNIVIPKVPASAQFYETLKSTVVPNRNAIFLAIATGYAQSIGANNVFYAAHYSDRGVYPDCREEFIEAFEKMSQLSLDNNLLSIESPFVRMNKSDVVKLGTELGVPYELTWSCYGGDMKHCGTCSACRERKRAFSEAGVKDPTVYRE
jgi:7-cyano-7-deazaguanine synthase